MLSVIQYGFGIVQEGGEAAEKPAGKPAKWANPILQKRAWSNAWLAFLAVPLPEAILRKVRPFSYFTLLRPQLLLF